MGPRWGSTSSRSAHLASLDTLERSSHSLAVAGGKAFVFGGELEPRNPVDADLAVVDIAGASCGPGIHHSLSSVFTTVQADVGLPDDADGSLSSLPASASTHSEWPSPRVGDFHLDRLGPLGRPRRQRHGRPDVRLGRDLEV